jgi:hypothetical protein
MQRTNGYLVSWPLQELTGAVAVADNIAVDLGRETVVNNGNPFTFTGDDLDSWTEINESAPNRVITECGSGEDRTGAGTGSVCLYSDSATSAQIRQDDLIAGRTYQIIAVCSFFNDLGSGSVKVQGASNAASAVLQITGVGTFQKTITVPTTGACRAQVSNAEATFDSLSFKQTDILASSAGLGLLDGDHTAVAVGQTGQYRIPIVASYDGATSYTDIDSAELNSIFDPTKGTLMVAARVANAGVWTDGGLRMLTFLSVDSNNWIFIRKTNTANQIAFEYRAAGVSEFVLDTSLSGGTDLFSVTLTWEYPGNMVAYINACQVGSPQAIAGVWAGNLAAAILGAAETVPTQVWHGDLAYPTLFNEPLTQPEIAAINRSMGIPS